MHKLAKYWAKIALLTQKRILVEDTEKFYKGKFTDPQTERERERQTNDNKSFDLQKIKMKSDAFKENFSVKDNSTLAFAIFKILHFFI